MYKYRNKDTGQLILTSCPCRGDSLEEIKEEPKAKKKATKKKTLTK